MTDPVNNHKPIVVTIGDQPLVNRARLTGTIEEVLDREPLLAGDDMTPVELGDVAGTDGESFMLLVGDDHIAAVKEAIGRRMTFEGHVGLDEHLIVTQLPRLDGEEVNEVLLTGLVHATERHPGGSSDLSVSTVVDGVTVVTKIHLFQDGIVRKHVEHRQLVRLEARMTSMTMFTSLACRFDDVEILRERDDVRLGRGRDDWMVTLDGRPLVNRAQICGYPSITGRRGSCFVVKVDSSPLSVLVHQDHLEALLKLIGTCVTFEGYMGLSRVIADRPPRLHDPTDGFSEMRVTGYVSHLNETNFMLNRIIDSDPVEVRILERSGLRKRLREGQLIRVLLRWGYGRPCSWVAEETSIELLEILEDWEFGRHPLGPDWQALRRIT